MALRNERLKTATITRHVYLSILRTIETTISIDSRGAPSQTKLEQFCFASLYPILEAFLNWYEFVTTESADYNCHHWMTPYGLYNPFVEGTEEKFRNYRLTGSHIGLKSRDA